MLSRIFSSASEEEADLGKEGEKVFKQMGFPQVESSKFNPADFPKVAKCINKRVTKLAAFEKQLEGIHNKDRPAVIVTSQFTNSFLFVYWSQQNLV